MGLEQRHYSGESGGRSVVVLLSKKNIYCLQICDKMEMEHKKKWKEIWILYRYFSFGFTKEKRGTQCLRI